MDASERWKDSEAGQEAEDRAETVRNWIAELQAVEAPDLDLLGQCRI